MLSFLQNTPNFADFKYFIIAIVAIHIVTRADGELNWIASISTSWPPG